MRRSFVMAVVAAILGVALGGQGDATPAPGEGKSLAPGEVIGEAALPPSLRPLATPPDGASPAHVPGAASLAPLLASGPLPAPPFPPAFASPTCLGARAARGPPASRS